MTDTPGVVLDILDDVWMAHWFRRTLWDKWGEGVVPKMWIYPDEVGLMVKGTNAVYRITIEELP